MPSPTLGPIPLLDEAAGAESFVLHRDVSPEGLWYVLYQEHEGKLKPVASASQGLVDCEIWYPTHK